MKLFRWLMIASVVAWAEGVSAQGAFMLRVIKQEDSVVRRDYKSSSGSYRSKSGDNTLAYDIEVTNAGLTTVSNVLVQCRLLYRDLPSGKLKVINNSKTTHLNRGERFTFGTEPIEIQSFHHSTLTKSHSAKAEFIGYAAEVIVAGKVMTSEIRPVGVKSQIETVLAEEAAQPTRIKPTKISP